MHEDTALDRYEIQYKIGCGAFSTVYKGVHLGTKCDVAVKVVDLDKFDDDERTGAIREVMVMLQFDHPNIATVYDYAIDDGKLYLFMEYFSNGNLLDKVNHTHGLTEDKARKYFNDITQAVFYLHNIRGIVHRDLKLQNMMISADDHIKLIDFGFCNSKIKSNLFTSFVGTPGFTAP